MSDPKYLQVKEFIRSRIQRDVWPGGEKIPAQVELERQCHVSRITVKRAIADLAAEGVLEYLPGKKGCFVKHLQARSPAHHKLIAVAIDDVRDTFGSDMLRGIEDYLWEKHYHTLVCNGDRDFNKVERYFDSLVRQPVAGVIFAPVIDQDYVENNRRILHFLEQHHLAFVLVDRYLPDCLTNYVVTSHRESSKQLVAHLLQRGHRRILLAKGMDCSSIAERVEGYRDAYYDMGIDVDERLIIQVNDNALYPEADPVEVERMKAFMQQAGQFSAFYALNCRILRTGIKNMLDLGIEIGTQVQLALHDAISKPYPPFTENMLHITQPAYQIGWEAAKILLEDIQHPQQKIVRIVLNSTLHYPVTV